MREMCEQWHGHGAPEDVVCPNLVVGNDLDPVFLKGPNLVVKTTQIGPR